MNPTVYIEREGRQFGLETRARVMRDEKGVSVLHEVDAPVFTFPVLRARIWAFRRGYGWPKIRAG
jgi:hypothetical protein